MSKLIVIALGVLLGVVAFEVFPEIFTLIQAHHMLPMAPMLAFVVGFLAFHIVEKLTIIHSMHENEYAEHRSGARAEWPVESSRSGRASAATGGHSA